jgi:hypothetical protein
MHSTFYTLSQPEQPDLYTTRAKNQIYTQPDLHSTLNVKQIYTQPEQKTHSQSMSNNK